MKLKTVKIKNFRGFKDEIIIPFENLTAFIGKNDAGKSTILEALVVSVQQNQLVFAIWNNGPAFSEEMLLEAEQLFYQSDQSRSIWLKPR